jgi:hypothetical protein
MSSAMRWKVWSPRPHGSSRSSPGSGSVPARSWSAASTSALARPVNAAGSVPAAGSAPV